MNQNVSLFGPELSGKSRLEDENVIWSIILKVILEKPVIIQVLYLVGITKITDVSETDY